MPKLIELLGEPNENKTKTKRIQNMKVGNGLKAKICFS